MEVINHTIRVIMVFQKLTTQAITVFMIFIIQVLTVGAQIVIIQVTTEVTILIIQVTMSVRILIIPVIIVLRNHITLVTMEYMKLTIRVIMAHKKYTILAITAAVKKSIIPVIMVAKIHIILLTAILSLTIFTLIVIYSMIIHQPHETWVQMNIPTRSTVTHNTGIIKVAENIIRYMAITMDSQELRALSDNPVADTTNLDTGIILDKFTWNVIINTLLKVVTRCPILTIKIIAPLKEVTPNILMAHTTASIRSTLSI